MIYCMSDIHGELDRFKAMLDLINFSSDDTLYIIGDVIDRHPGGVEILKIIKDTPNMFMLLGNHEQMCLDTLGPNSVYGSRRLWLENGGSNTYRELLYALLPFFVRRFLYAVSNASIIGVTGSSLSGLDRCSGLHIVLRYSVKGQHGIRNFLCAVLILRGVVRAIRASDPLFLCAKDSHNLAVNLGNFAGSFHANHALAVLRSPEVVIERDRGFRDFHCSSFPLRGSSGKGEDRKRAA